MGHPKTGKPYKIDVGYERFLGPELFFNPEIYGTQNVTPLPQLIDECIQNCQSIQEGSYIEMWYYPEVLPCLKILRVDYKEIFRDSVKLDILNRHRDYCKDPIFN